MVMHVLKDIDRWEWKARQARVPIYRSFFLGGSGGGGGGGTSDGDLRMSRRHPLHTSGCHSRRRRRNAHGPVVPRLKGDPRAVIPPRSATAASLASQRSLARCHCASTVAVSTANF